MNSSSAPALTNNVLKEPPPGPRGHPLFGNLIALSTSTNEYMARCTREYGNVVRFRMPWPMSEVVLINEPRLIKRVLVDDADAFRKGVKQRRGATVLGKGLLLAEGEAWKRQRRMLQPAFHRAKVESHLPVVRAAAEALAERWRQGGNREMTSDALGLTLRVAAQTMFGASIGAEAERIATTFERGYAASEATARGASILPVLVPLMNALLMKRASGLLESIVFEFIIERRRTGEDRGDLLSMLLKARDEDGSGLSDRQIRDEAITALFTGSETTALALAWTFHLLAQNPDVAEGVRGEIAGIVGAGEVRSEHLPFLKLLERVLKESLRLYPPLSRIHREALRDIELENFLIQRGTQVVTSPYLAHRDPTYFPEPDRFLPARWTEEFEQALPRFAYFPFGGGPRVCIGAGFAMMELAVVIATVLPRVHLEPTGQVPVPVRGSILRAAGGVHIRVSSL